MLVLACIALTGLFALQSSAKIDPATIAGMWLFDEGSGDTAKDSSQNGNDGAITAAEWVDGWIKLDFPSEPPRATSAPPGMLEALGRKAVYVGKNESRYLVEIESEEAVRKLSPDMAGLVAAGV